jgi:hypothetical protein
MISKCRVRSSSKRHSGRPCVALELDEEFELVLFGQGESWSRANLPEKLVHGRLRTLQPVARKVRKCAKVSRKDTGRALTCIA